MCVCVYIIFKGLKGWFSNLQAKSTYHITIDLTDERAELLTFVNN